MITDDMSQPRGDGGSEVRVRVDSEREPHGTRF